MSEYSSPFFLTSKVIIFLLLDIFCEDGFWSARLQQMNCLKSSGDDAVSLVDHEMIVYFQKVADEHRDFALRVNRLIGEMNEACSDREAFVWELQNVTGETVQAMTVGFLEKMMDKEGNMEWKLRSLEKEAREMAFEIESFLFKLMDAEPSHRRVFGGDYGQRG
ncbi:hypothetical protein Tco_0770670 [Tanacetum coccineum]|uniref:Uncharacterized protein n=1 Tax=Tanacetum coccineum TaxID=301880 RepID=A0ABQ4ZCV4_9ASTR